MNQGSLSRREWIYRFADRMVEATDYEMCLGEAVTLARAEHERWAGASPEATVARLLAACRIDERLIDARQVPAGLLRPAKPASVGQWVR